MNSAHIKALLKYSLGLGLLAYVIIRNWEPSNGSPGLAGALARPIQLVPLILAALALLASSLLTFVRWYVLVRAQDLPFTLSNSIRIGMIGFFFNTFLPGSIGGDLVKAVAIARTQSRRAVAVSTVLVDRAVGLWGLVWLVALLGGTFWLANDPVLAASAGLRTIVRSAWLIGGVTVGAWILLGVLPERRSQRFARRLTRLPKVGHAFAEFWRAVWLYRTQPRAIVIAMLLSLISQTGNVFSFHYAAQVFVDPADVDRLPTLTEDLLIVPVGMVIQAVFPAPGGVGGSEYGFGKLFALLGRPEAYGILASLAQRALGWVIGLLGYLFYLRAKPSLPSPDRADDPIIEPVGVTPA